MQETILRAREMSYPGIILFGHPEYYPRFGFKNAKVFSITTKQGENMEPFMALELVTGSFEGIRGKFYEDEIFFSHTMEELEEFDKKFPYKKKLKMDMQFE